MILVFDNGKAGPEHQLAFVEPQGSDEIEALRRFEGVLRADPFRAGAGIVLQGPDLGVRPELLLTVTDFFEGPWRWDIQLFDPDTLGDEEITAVLAFAGAWPTQRNVSAALVEDVRREAARRGFARDALVVPPVPDEAVVAG